MRRIDRQVLRAGLSSLAAVLLLLPPAGPDLAAMAALGLSLGMLLAAWGSEFRAGHQADILTLAQRHGLGNLAPETRQLVGQIRKAILTPETLAAYDPAHDRSLKSLAAACLGLLCLLLAVGPSGVFAATFLLLLAEVRRPKIQEGIRVAWTIPA
jgi:hypothetical protein